MWVDASANRVATAYASAPLCNRQLTERRILGVSLSRKSAVWAGDVTERRILGGRRDLDVTEKRILRVGLTKGRILHASSGCAERPSSPICVHSCIPTAARATGRGHGPHDIEGPMAPVMPGRSDLRSTPPGR